MLPSPKQISVGRKATALLSSGKKYEITREARLEKATEVEARRRMAK